MKQIYDLILLMERYHIIYIYLLLYAINNGTILNIPNIRIIKTNSNFNNFIGYNDF